MSFRFSASNRCDGVAPSRSRRRVRGFTLIELMIVVAVVAILAAIAYPSFNDSVRKSRRGQAKADLVEMAQIYERYHTEMNTYVGGKARLGSLQSPRTGTARYLITDPSGTETASTFLLTATPQDGQAKDVCGTLTVDHAGRKTPDQEGCWQ